MNKSFCHLWPNRRQISFRISVLFLSWLPRRQEPGKDSQALANFINRGLILRRIDLAAEVRSAVVHDGLHAGS